MAEKDSVFSKLYNFIKGELDFDGDSFYFNQLFLVSY